MDVRPIRSDEEHTSALAETDRLWGADPDTADGARLEILLLLVDAYEDAHHPMPPSDPISAIEFMMEQRGLTRRDLEPMIGSRARVAEVLNRKRALTLPMIRRLSEGLDIPANIARLGRILRWFPLSAGVIAKWRNVDVMAARRAPVKLSS